MGTQNWKPTPMLTDEQRAAALRGEAVEIIPAPGEGKRIVMDESRSRYRIENSE